MTVEAQRGSTDLAQALADLSAGLERWPLWWALAWQDIRRRYRGSLLGPLWITLTMGVTVGAIGIIYSQLFGIEIDSYMPFLCLGILLWSLILGLTVEGCNAFIGAQGTIHQTRLPLSLFVMKSVCHNLLLFAHHVVIFAVVAALFPVVFGWTTLLAIPGLVLYVLNGVWIGLLFGTLCARFRDIPPIVTSVMQVAFFVTPVFWHPDQLGHRRFIAEANPFYHYLAVVRQPLLGQIPPFESWAVVLLATVAGWILALTVFARCRRSIVFWV